MSTTEDRARAAMRAIAATVNDAPSLQLRPARDPGRAPGEWEAASGPPPPGAARPGKFRPGGRGRGPRRPGGVASPSGRGRDRRWRTWLAPVTAAAVVIALAIALVVVKNLPNGDAVPGNPASAASPGGPSRPAVGPGGAPRYYVALRSLDVGAAAKLSNFARYGIVVGDSLTGKTLATFAPPAGTTFQNVSAAADDRTFAVFAVTSSTGTFMPMKSMLSGSWYEVRLAPGTAQPARLSRLPIKPWSWVATGNPYADASPGQIYATALSGSGRELAVADVPGLPGAGVQPQGWQEVKVFSVATGRLLHDWTGNDPGAKLMTVVGSSMAGVPEGTPALTWIDGDQALALATSSDESNKVTGVVRRLNVTGPVSGNLVSSGSIAWSGALPWGGSATCFTPASWPPLIGASGNTITCTTFATTATGVGRIDIITQPLAAGATAASQARLDYQVTWPSRLVNGKLVNPGGDAGVLWASPSAGTLIVESVPGGNLSPPKDAYFGVVSNGKYTPLRIPKSLAASTVQDITF
jgi:hypothetical protein